MKTIFEEPVLKIIRFELKEDILTGSTPVETDENGLPILP